MESQDYVKLVNEGIKVYKSNKDIQDRFKTLLGLVEEYPKGWFAADGYRLRGLLELMADANRVHESMEKSADKNTEEVRRFYGSFLAKFDAEIRRLKASYVANEGAKQFKEEKEKAAKKVLKKN